MSVQMWSTIMEFSSCSRLDKNTLHFNNKHTRQISEIGTGFKKLSAEGFHFEEDKLKENFAVYL